MTSNNPIRPADRVTRLKVQQTLKMGRSAHAYVRGSTIQFYEWLEAQRSGTLLEGPPTWICGDYRTGNFGPVALRNSNDECDLIFDRENIGAFERIFIRSCRERAARNWSIHMYWRLSIPALAALSVLSFAGTSPASATTVQDSFCLQGRQSGYPGNCSFSSFAQCKATASGTNEDCEINPMKAYSTQRRSAIRYHGAW